MIRKERFLCKKLHLDISEGGGEQRKEWFHCKKLHLDISEGDKFKTLVGVRVNISQRYVYIGIEKD